MSKAANAAQAMESADADADDGSPVILPESCDCGRDICSAACSKGVVFSGNNELGDPAISSPTQSQAPLIWTQPRVVVLVLTCLVLLVALFFRK